LASLAATSTLFQLNQHVQAVSLLEQNLSQVDAEVGLSTKEMVDGMLENMAQDGVIRIPIKKQETGFFSQVGAEADAEMFMDPWHAI